MLIALYAPKGPAPFDILFTRAAVVLALLFVTLAFVLLLFVSWVSTRQDRRGR